MVRVGRKSEHSLGRTVQLNNAKCSIRVGSLGHSFDYKGRLADYFKLEAHD